MHINSKLPATGTTIFTTMSALAQEYGAINLGQGFPDFDMPEQLQQLVSQAMHDGFNQYAPMQGHLPLRSALAEKIFYLYGLQVEAQTDITITPGGTYAIYTALTAILQPGDEVIVFQPAYDSYIPNILVNGAIPVKINLQFPDYTIDWQEVEETITSRTRLIMINSPHNPTGAVLSSADMQALQELVVKYDLLVLSDEVYEHLIFDGKQHESVLRYPALFARAFACFSFGKVYHCTGWKLGYCVAPKQLMEEFRKIHQYNCFSCHTPAQIALAAYIQQKETYLSLAHFLQGKRDYFQSLMQQTKFEALPSSGSYFQLFRYTDISDAGELEMAIRLTKEYGVACIPVSSFYDEKTDNGVLRFCFAKKESTLQLAAERLLRI